MEQNGEFLKELLRDLLKDLRGSISKFKDLKSAVTSLIAETKDRPCFQKTAEAAIVELAEYYIERDDRCKNCVVKVIERQLAFKNKLILCVVSVLSSLAVGTAVAGGWYLWIK